MMSSRSSHHSLRTAWRSAPARPQRGAATLIVVMILFFVISMVGAYTSRNLIFEQRTAANQYRATQAFEAAEAGIEWTVAQLNAGRMTDACTASSSTAVSTTELAFRTRYLNINSTTGTILRRNPSGGGSVTPTCTFDSHASVEAEWRWSCHCPRQNQATTPTAQPVQEGPAPAFLVQMVAGGRNDIISVESIGCTRASASCLDFDTKGATGDGVSQVTALVALRSAITRLPSAPLTVVGTLAPLPSGTILYINNTASSASGLTIHSGGSVPTTGGTMDLKGLPGMPPASTTAADDVTLVAAAASAPTGYPTVSSSDRRFAAFFGMPAAVYQKQPGMPVIDCSTGCNASRINDTLRRNPGRAIWLTGDTGTLTLDVNVGTDTEPALIITEGNVNVSNGVVFKGLIYGRKTAWDWTLNGAATLTGAVIAENGLSFGGSGSGSTLSYDSNILRVLRLGYGTFVRVPGSWRDFATP